MHQEIDQQAPHAPSDRHYVITWAWLMSALGVSLLIGALAGGAVTVALIFGIAVAKAALVAGRFMHLSAEPRWVLAILLGGVLAVGAFYIGVAPDVVWGFGRVAP